ncbi:MAG: YjjG family noncanonical pyrimidine nucleotidase [Bacteroidetes bacterium]|nr:YjjG family noncanonical pyrimidine nucleotidase [Bacteroidota bacterium]
MAKPTLLLLDLDNTLWDFDANAEEALCELFHRHHLHLRTGHSVDHFVRTYKNINKAYWKRYESRQVSKDVLRVARFTDTFLELGLPAEEHPPQVWEEYLEICPVMTRMMPGAIAFLEEMRSVYRLGLVTNGFDQTQLKKIQVTGIQDFIELMVTSEGLGAAKPEPEIFHHALNLASVPAAETLYMGDTWDTDVAGGIRAGIRTAWYNHSQIPPPADGLADHPLYLGQFGSLLEAGSFLAGLGHKE